MNDSVLWALLVVVCFVTSLVGAAAGLVLGHFRLPLLVRLMGQVPGTACNLLVSGIGAFAGAYRHFREGHISWPSLALMGLPSIAGAASAAYLFAKVIPGDWAHLIIGLMLVVSGLNLSWPDNPNRPPEDDVSRPNPLFEIVVGLGLGALAAVTGLMLGSLRLPMMIRILRLDPKVAVGSNLAIGFMTAMVAAATSLSVAKQVDWYVVGKALLLLGPPTMLGGWLGGLLTGRMRKETVKFLAGQIIMGIGVIMAFQAAEGLTQLRAGKGGETVIEIDFEDD